MMIITKIPLEISVKIWKMLQNIVDILCVNFKPNRKIIIPGPSGRFPRTAGPGESHSGPRDFSKPFTFFCSHFQTVREF